MTLLQMVQSILSDMTSDEVNSISDTSESLQVANIIRENYSYLISKTTLPEHRSLFELESSGRIDQPVLMRLPPNATELLWLKYDASEETTVGDYYVPVYYRDIDDFVDYMHGLVATDGLAQKMTLTLGTNSIDFYYSIDKAPTYYTTFDDNTIIFDSYNSLVDTTLQKNKTIAFGTIAPTFEMSDNFIPQLDAIQFSLLFNESKAQAFAEVKQIANANAERKARNQWITSQKSKRGVRGYDELTNLNRYGRTRNGRLYTRSLKGYYRDR